MSLELIRPGTNFSFIGYRYYAFAFSGLMILVSILSIAFHGGLNLGVDFQGGLLIQARFSDPAVTPDSVWETFAASPFAVSSVQDFGQSGDTEYLINLNATGDAPDGDLSLLASAVLNERYGADKVEIRRQEMVGPKVGADLRQKALYAIFYAILIIIIYISGRFEKRWGTPLLFCAILLGVIYLVSLFAVGVGALIITALIVTVITCYFMKFSFALGGILALLHDIIITTGAFSLMGKEITLSFVAAVLTIIGYSLNDSIIVFDRIRENVSRNPRLDYPATINKSINETLSRTILTSGTTILALISLYFLGGPVNKDFALALIIGIVVGTYSSIFIASPILLVWEKNAPKAPPKEEKSPPRAPFPLPALKA